MKDRCYFCGENDEENPFSYKICEFSYSKLYLFKEQIYLGRCILAAKSHVPEFYYMPLKEKEGFLKELELVSQTLEKLFHAEKMNFASIGDSSGHLHIHIVPKHRTDEKWGDMFEVNAHRGYLQQQEYEALIDKIREAFQEKKEEKSYGYSTAACGTEKV